MSDRDRPADAETSIPDVVELGIGPELDLHAFAPPDIASVVETYVCEAHRTGIRTLRLIHGRGRGVQRGVVQAALERHPLVATFWDDTTSHLGATIAQLRPDSGTPVA